MSENERGKHRYEMNNSLDGPVYDEQLVKDTETLDRYINNLFERCEDRQDVIQLSDWLITNIAGYRSMKLLTMECVNKRTEVTSET